MALYERSDYTANISYLHNTLIYELDIHKANISILLSKGLISQNLYDALYNAERTKRQVFIGRLQKNPSIALALKEGIREAKRLLVETNNIQDFEILSIKNDAVYVIGRMPQITKFGLIDFRCKNVYTGFYKVQNLELYYLYNTIDKSENLSVKGINDDKLVQHNDYMIRYLKDLFYTIQCEGIEQAIRLHKKFYLKYINKDLDIGFYRRFRSTSDYYLVVTTQTGVGFSTENDYMPELVDISHNLGILIDLQKILNSIYFTRRSPRP